jgi:predicted DsbA family dithiol-disulfide isomerase
MYDHLRLRGKEFDIVFGDRTILSNSRLALEASEYARDMGKHAQFHEHMFHAYFTEALDIGNLEAISSVASRCDIDIDDMMNVLKDGRYKPRLDEARRKGRKIGLTGVPTFIINDQYEIVGAQAVEVFADLFKEMGIIGVLR